MHQCNTTIRKTFNQTQTQSDNLREGGRVLLLFVIPLRNQSFSSLKSCHMFFFSLIICQSHKYE